MTHFKNDLFKRKEQAERLLEVFSKSQSGLVVTIDAPWGDGKTYFADNFKQMLDDLGCKSILIDAFRHDYIEDPFVLLTGSIYGEFTEKSKEVKSLKKQALVLGKKVWPALWKITATIASAGVISGEVQKNIAQIASDAMANIIEEQISNYEEATKDVAKFKDTLASIALKCRQQTETVYPNKGQPLVIIIDELDRCSPIFAVKMLERIKHFFFVDNVVFVLMVNKNQLTAYIKGMYGIEVDGEGYLEKFIDLSINLSSLPPKQRDSNCRIYAEKCEARRQYIDINNKLDEELFHFLIKLTSIKYIPLRCIDKYYLYTQFVSKDLHRDLSWYAGILILIKILKPNLYDKFLARDQKATEAVRIFFTDEMPTKSETELKLMMMIEGYYKQLPEIVFTLLEHNIFINFNADLLREYQNDVNKWCSNIGGPKDAFHIVSQYVDFKV